jgi:hypothetical protein
MRKKVKENIRKTKRDLLNIFNNDFLKMITEIILNSDDSYKRIEKHEKENSKKRIVINLDREKGVVEVTDFAEGMSAEDLDRIFSDYGGDHNRYSHDSGVRGLFGQGAGDVLHYSAFLTGIAKIESIKDNVVSKCTFYFKDDKEIEVKEIHPHIKQYRKSKGISENGTIITFGINDEIILPSKKTIKEKIEEFYMLRYILSDSMREVLFYDDDLMHRLDSSRYLYDDSKAILRNKKFKILFEDFVLDATMNLYEKGSLNDNTKIIIRDDEMVIYDETYFGYDNSLGINELTGELIIPEVSNLLRYYLNCDNPKSILTDTRDGFDGRAAFTKEMFKKVGKILEKALNEYNDSKGNEPIDLSHNKQLNNLMKQINDYYRELELSSIEGINSGTNPPQDGLQFARRTVSITRGKTYALKIYINPDQIPVNTDISFSIIDNNYIELQNSSVSYSEEDIKEDAIVIKSAVIKGLKVTDEPVILTANCGQYKTSVAINVVDAKIIYPQNGLEFIPKRKTTVFESKAKFNLYFDTEVIPIGSKIIIESKSKGQLFSDVKELIVVEKFMIADTIGVFKYEAKAGEFIDETYIIAKFNDIEAKATLYTREKKKRNEGNEGFLNKIELSFEETIWQSNLDSKKGIVYISAKHPINIANLGDLKKIDKNKPSFNSKQRKYLFELIAFESAKRIAEENTKQNFTYFKDGYDLLRFIQKHKTQIYKILDI